MANLNKTLVYEKIQQYVIEKGREPLYEELLEYIGRGSMGTIHRHLSAWRREHKKKETPVMVERSEDNISFLPSSLEKVWVEESKRLQEIVWKELAIIRRAKDEELAEKEEVISDTNRSLEECRVQLDKASHVLEKNELELSERSKDSEVLTEKLNSMEERLEKTLANEINKALEEIHRDIRRMATKATTTKSCNRKKTVNKAA